MTTTARRAVTAIAVPTALVAVLAGCTPKPASHPAGQGRSQVSSAPAHKTTKPFVTWSVLHECGGGPRGTFTIYFDAPPHQGGAIAMITYGGGLNPPKTTDTSTMVNVYLRPTRVPQEIGKGPIEIPAVPGWISITGPAVIQPPTHLTISPTTGCPTPHATQVQPARRRLTAATHRPAVSHQPVVKPRQHPASPAPVARRVVRPVAAAPPLTAMQRCEAALAARPGWTARAIADGGSFTCVPSISNSNSDLPPSQQAAGMTGGMDTQIRADVPDLAAIISYEAAHQIDNAELTDGARAWFMHQIGATQWVAASDTNWVWLGAERWSWTVAACQGYGGSPLRHAPAAPCSLIRQTLSYARGVVPASVLPGLLASYEKAFAAALALPGWQRACKRTAVRLVSCPGWPAGSVLGYLPVPDPGLVRAGLVPANANTTTEAG